MTKIKVCCEAEMSGLAGGLLSLPFEGSEGMDQLADLYGDVYASDLRAEVRELFEPASSLSADWLVLEDGAREGFADRFVGACRTGKPVLAFRPKDGAHRFALPVGAAWRERPIFDVRRSIAVGSHRTPGVTTIPMPAFPHRDWQPYGLFSMDVSIPRKRRSKMPIVGFMGQVKPAERRSWIAAVESSDQVVPWVVEREGFSMQLRGDAFDRARRAYVEQLTGCDFILCPPGAGLYTYRMYEALSCGAIPVVTAHAVYPDALAREAVQVADPYHIPAQVIGRWRNTTSEEASAVGRTWWSELTPIPFVRELVQRMRGRA